MAVVFEHTSFTSTTAKSSFYIRTDFGYVWQPFSLQKEFLKEIKYSMQTELFLKAT
jgi:hypothetical protein